MFSCSCSYKERKGSKSRKFCISQFSELHNKWSEKEGIITTSIVNSCQVKMILVCRARFLLLSIIYFIFFSCTQFILIFIALKSFMNIQNILLQKLHNAPFFTCVSCVWQIVHYSRYFWSRFNALKKCAMMDTRIFICFFSVFLVMWEML